MKNIEELIKEGYTIEFEEHDDLNPDLAKYVLIHKDGKLIERRTVEIK